MKNLKCFSLYFVILFSILLLAVQPTSIIYYIRKDTSQPWELLSNTSIQEGHFTDDPQEITFVYRRKKAMVPIQFMTFESKPRLMPQKKNHSTQYGQLLLILSGIFLFGSPRP
ncbi:MucBP domain-containing protein [Enterococcus crotali]|uniref:MucBP domain-containing protein n=1 Tax=Enterococcus crotali TaxID=1453587 RepID=UPI0004728E04|nr:MucBP domain-containing protein [Enterococcus crotali]